MDAIKDAQGKLQEEAPSPRDLTIGVLALQGAVSEHMYAVERCGARAIQVKKPSHLHGIDGLIIPGGESTAIGKLMVEYGFLEPIRSAVAGGMGVFGTCAGLILLAKEIVGSEQPRLGLLDIAVQRNGFGRQRESFEIDLEISELGEEPFRAVFIRAPYIESVGRGVRVMAAIDGKIVLVREGKLLAAAFHPELTDDLRLHRYFLRCLL